jgi:hypothetical protein
MPPQTHVRAQLAVITTSLAAAALLAGPAATWALDVTGVTGSSGATSQVTQTAQSVVTSTEQTAATTVTDVATTTETAVQQAVAPVTNQVQSAAGAVTTAPAHTAPAGTPPIRKKPSAGTHAAAPVGNPARQTGAAPRALATVGRSAHVRGPGRGAASPRVASGQHRLARPLGSTSPTTDATGAGGPAPSCGGSGVLNLLNPILAAAPNLGGLVTVACDAAATLDLAPLTPTDESTQQVTTPAGLLHTFAAVLAATAGRAHARAAVTGHSASPTVGPRGAIAAAALHPSGVGAPHGAAGNDSVRYASLPHADAVTTAGTHPALTPTGHSGGGLFHTSITGTELVFALLVLDWAFVVAVVMWRIGRRRPLARLLYRLRPA